MAYLHRGLVGPFIRIKFYSLTLNFFIKIHVLFREDLMKIIENTLSHIAQEGEEKLLDPFLFFQMCTISS